MPIWDIKAVITHIKVLVGAQGIYFNVYGVDDPNNSG